MSFVSPLTWDVDASGGSLAVDLHGAPSGSSVSALGAVLTARLAHRPPTLLINVSAGSTAPGLFSLFSGLTGRHPPATIVELAGGGADRPACLGDARRVALPLARSLVAAGTALLSEQPARQSHRDELLPLPGAARLGRNAATEACVRWDLPHLIGAAARVTSELITYGTRRAGSMMTLSFVWCGDSMYLAVRHGPVAAPPRPGGRQAGFGLFVLSTVASRWGLLPVGDDTIIWAAVATGVRRRPG